MTISQIIEKILSFRAYGYSQLVSEVFNYTLNYGIEKEIRKSLKELLKNKIITKSSMTRYYELVKKEE